MKKIVCLILSVLSVMIMIVGVPIVINELYKSNTGYLTLWGAPEVLSYYGAVLSFAGTVVLGIIAVWQNKKANDVSQMAMEIGRREKMPYLKPVNRILHSDDKQIELEFENKGNSFATVKNVVVKMNDRTALMRVTESFVDCDERYILRTGLKVPEKEENLELTFEFVLRNAFGFEYLEILTITFTPKSYPNGRITFSSNNFNIVFREIE